MLRTLTAQPDGIFLIIFNSLLDLTIDKMVGLVSGFILRTQLMKG